jgi:peptidoglycan/xylan/chitin deacetylase (PgdA/CDA1 family)
VRRALTVGLLLGLGLAGPAAADGPRIAITIDDLPINGPDAGLAELARINRAVVQALRGAEVPAVGFVNEEKLYRAGEVDGRIALLEEWLAAGLELGNHTFSHPDLNKVGLAAYQEEIVRGETVTRLLARKHGRPLRRFRHTFLRTGRTAEDKAGLLAFLQARGYVMAPVTVENDDWYFNARYVKARAGGDAELARRIGEAYLQHWTVMFDWYDAMAQRLFGRSVQHVALLHQNALNADYLPRVLALMRDRGLRFATLDEVLKDPAYGHEDRYVGGWGKSWLQRWAWTEGHDTFGQEPDPPEWLMKLEP